MKEKNMKSILFCCIVTCLFAACQNQQKQSPEEMMSGRKTLLLYGNIGKVSNSDGSFVEFNKDGNIVRRKDGKRNAIQEYQYENSQRYMYLADKQYYNIVYTENTRSEVWDNPVEQLSVDYIFDSNGRLTAMSRNNYGWSVNETHEYKGNDLLPYKTTEIFSDETGMSTAIVLYTYIEIDNNGNWLNCDKEITIENEQFDDESDKSEKTVKKEKRSASRSIEYFTDDEGDAEKDDKEAIIHVFDWSKKKFPCDIPFKVLNKGNGAFPWEIQSITCKGQAKDKSGYNFIVKGIGAVNSKNYTFGSKTVTFVPEEKNSTSINGNQTAAYIFPGVDKGEPFEFEFKGLFPGYCNDNLFAGFLILND